MKKLISEILVPERRREELGDLAGLSSSIEKYGLIQPIVLDDSGTLIAGERRLEACKRLGWTEVEVRSHGELTEDERLAIELEENIRRKDLTTLEYHKNMKRLAKTAERLITVKKQEEKSPRAADELLLTDNNNSRRGAPPKDAATQQEIADELGISRATLSLGEQYVGAVEKYPEIGTTPGVPMTAAIKMAQTLDSLPEEVRDQKRQALQNGQRNILADLTGLPPLPPVEPAETDSQKQWSTGLKHLRQAIRELSDDETLQSMMTQWTQDIAKKQHDTLRQLADRLHATASRIFP